MTTLTIEIPEKIEKTLSDLIEQLGGKVIVSDSNSVEHKKLTQTTEKLSRKDKKFLEEFDEAIEFVNLHQQAKVKAKTIDHLLNEL
jgi:cysteine synthase